MSRAGLRKNAKIISELDAPDAKPTKAEVKAGYARRRTEAEQARALLDLPRD